MQCPACRTVTLAMTERQGIEIDYCPSCRGVWLDRGELDRLIERASPPPPAADPRGHGQFRHGQAAGAGYRQKKPKSLLGELFDF